MSATRLLRCIVLAACCVPFARAQADATYLPMDSWVYGAVDDLSQRGVLPPVWLSLRPWTQSTVADLLSHAEEPREPEDVERLALLRKEVSAQGEPSHPYVDTLRQRVTAVAGQPIQDGFHFAQTTVNDQGRSIAEGANIFTGMTMRGHVWRFAGFVDGEFQRVPGGFALPPAAASAIAATDFTPQAAQGPQLSFARGRLLQAYVVLPFGGNTISVGRQSLWWGPARSGATLFSTNAEPITMVRYDRVDPIRLPRPFRWLGEVRAQALLGRLGGAQFIHADHQTFGSSGEALSNQPWIHAEKLSFHPAKSFEFSVSRSVLFAGVGAPLTTRSFVKSMFSAGTGDEQEDPGDRRAAFDASWVLPRMHGCVRTYVDTFTDDEPFPLAYVKESAWITGFSLNCLPGTKRLTLRAEGLVSPHRDIFPGFYYFNVHYISGYTQQRQLIGSWIGREGKGAQVWATLNASAKTQLEISIRSMFVDREFLQGGSLQDVQFTAHHVADDARWEWQAQAQVERWRFPIVNMAAHYNVALTGQLTWHPFRR